jgi:hypothetical protein
MLSFDPITGEWIDDTIQPAHNWPVQNASTPANLINPRGTFKPAQVKTLDLNILKLEPVDRSTYLAANIFNGTGGGQAPLNLIKPDDNTTGLLIELCAFVSVQNRDTFYGIRSSFLCGFCVDTNTNLLIDGIYIPKFICTADAQTDGSDVFVTSTGKDKNIWIPPKQGLFIYWWTSPAFVQSYYVKYRKGETL